MPIHDWARVEDASFHDFHQTWLAKLKGRLNRGLLPEGYFAHIEWHLGRFESDELTLATLPVGSPPRNGRPQSSGSSGGVTVATRPPKATARLSASPTRGSKVVVRQMGNKQVIALIELHRRRTKTGRRT